MKTSYALLLAIIALMIIAPYAVFAKQRDWLLYWFWTILTLAVILIGWLETGRWK